MPVTADNKSTLYKIPKITPACKAVLKKVCSIYIAQISQSQAEVFNTSSTTLI